MEDDNGSVNNVDNRKIELLTIVSFETLNQNNKKLGKQENFSLIQQSIDCKIRKKKTG